MPMTPSPQSNDAPDPAISGVPNSVIISTLTERLKATRAELEQAKRERDEKDRIFTKLSGAISADFRNAEAILGRQIGHMSGLTDEITALRAQLADMTAHRDTLAAEFNKLVSGELYRDAMKALDERIAERDEARAQLEKERAFIKTIQRMVDVAEQVTDAQSEQEVAASASFNEALALTTLEITERERDAAQAQADALRQQLEAAQKAWDIWQSTAETLRKELEQYRIKAHSAIRERDQWEAEERRRTEQCDLLERELVRTRREKVERVNELESALPTPQREEPRHDAP